MISDKAAPVSTKTKLPRFALSTCILRPWELSDDSSLASHANNRNIWIHQLDGFPHPFTLEHAQGWLERVQGETPPHSLAVEVDGQAVGTVGLHFQKDVYRRSAEVGYWIGEPYWGRGIMTEALHTFVEYSFGTFDLCRIFARIFAWNPASARVARKVGFRLEGRLRKAVTKAERTTDLLLFSVVR